MCEATASAEHHKNNRPARPREASTGFVPISWPDLVIHGAWPSSGRKGSGDSPRLNGRDSSAQGNASGYELENGYYRADVSRSLPRSHHIRPPQPVNASVLPSVSEQIAFQHAGLSGLPQRNAGWHH